MLERSVPSVVLVAVTLVSVVHGQSCIRNEVLAALEEVQSRSPSVVTSENQSACINTDSAQIKELNSTMQESFNLLKKDLQDFRQGIKDEMQEIEELLSTILSLHFNPGLSPSNPALSCKEIYNRNTSSPSGYYWLQSSSEKITRAYCDMERTCGGVQGGWMKVASIDMTDSTNSCPSGLLTLTSPKRLCATNISGAGCSSAFFNVHAVPYSKVCGKIIGYQQTSPDAFVPYQNNRALTIDDNYVDGISLTHGQNPRKHVWTFAAALHEVLSYPLSMCPCTNIHNHVTIPIPPYVGSDYFCDTGSSEAFRSRLYLEDPLWDGDGCGPLNTCCSFNSPPWFMKQLPAKTDDNLEVRLCSDSPGSDEDINFETLELYIQ